ncbi:hypothetical protein T484DRAFT_3633367 [Baffinella frigidus]|nr:hypothetical protein T484DRAFT_3633367 [Cryptophyta sp. CCMP2293]
MEQITANGIPPPTRTNDTIFDFPVSQNGHIQSVGSHALLVRGGSEQTHTGRHLSHASQRFAQQLDVDAIKEQSRYMDDGFNATAELTSLFMQSTKLVEEQNFNSIINAYLTFTQTSNMLPRDVINSFKRSIVSSLKLADTTSICEGLNYEASQQGLLRVERRVENVYGEYSEWQKILQILSFTEAQVQEYLFTVDSDFGHDLPTIKFVFGTLEQIGVDNLSTTDTLKLYLLTNIKNISSLVAIKAFLVETMPATSNAHEAANIFTASIADTRFTQAQFSHDLTWFMQNLIIAPDFHDKCIFFLDTKESMLKWSQRENTKQHNASGRVRLRYRVGTFQDETTLGATVETNSDGVDSIGSNGLPHGQQTQNTNAASQMSQMQEDSLQGWSLRARVPPAISHKSKLLGYVLVAQMNFADPSDAIRKHFLNDSEIASNMLANRLCKPQASAIIEFLHLLTVHVTPFTELIAFRAECFTDFSYTDSKDLSWLKFLQLYIASYQNVDIWPHIWKNFCGVLSHQVLIAVGNFKTKYTYAVDKVAEICMQDEESSRKAVHEIR